MSNNSKTPWPELPTAAWRDTYATLHLWTQIVGKIRLTKSPWLNHSWHVTLYVTPRGLTTSPIPDGTRTFQIDFDFIDHALRISTSDGAQRQFALAGTIGRELLRRDHGGARRTRHCRRHRRDAERIAGPDAVFARTPRMRPTIPMRSGASCRSSSTATASSSNSAPAFSARRARCISSGAVSISR